MDIEGFIAQRKDIISASLLKLKAAFAQESKETKQMIDIYLRYNKGEASSDEVAIADAQLRDLMKSLGIGVFTVLPFAPITLPVIFLAAEKLGIDIIPSSFKTDKTADEQAK